MVTSKHKESLAIINAVLENTEKERNTIINTFIYYNELEDTLSELTGILDSCAI